MQYDLIIIGAGSAGCAVAARATENPHLNVLLLEAGPDYPDLAATPADLVNSHNNSYRDHDWHLQHLPTADREVPLPRGRVVGGSSAVNTTIALRGMPEDYDEWAAAGNPAWAWDNVLPAFNRLERDLDYGAAPYHGDAGPISIRRYPEDELLPQHQAFLDRAVTLGYAACPDANAPTGDGAGPHPMNKLGRLRVSCAVGYLAPARIRPNLTIAPNALVRRVLAKQRKASGVEWETPDGAVHTASAPLVILCAGAIMSPAILMRSGIGARSQLEQIGIDLCADLPGVGANLSDHPALAVAAAVKDGVPVDPDVPIIQTILRYTAPGSSKRNDLQIEQLSFSPRRDGRAAFAIAAVLEYQYGRGELTLSSADPHAAPKINNRFCEDPRDAERLAQCWQDTLAFTTTGPLAEMIDEVLFPDPRQTLSSEAAQHLCRKLSGSGFHPCGTVKMGPSADPMAVVDQYGHCHGVEGLVVADASIMPSVPRANTNLTSIMIGEMIGEWLRTDPQRYGF